MRLPAGPLAALEAQRGYLFPWVPVCLGIGIGLYFWLPVEPGPRALAAAGSVATGLGLAGLRGPERWRPLAMAGALVLAGLVAAALRSQAVAAPVLPYRAYGPVEGRVVKVDRSSSDHPRLTLDRVALAKVAPEEVPRKVRLTLTGEVPPGIAPGQRVQAVGLLGPPQGPAEPGGFDFQRFAWFDGLGAVGYTRMPVTVAGEDRPGGLFFDRLRQHIADSVRARLPGDPGGFVAAILTNDTAGLSQAALQDLRVANLAHMLSISGLHMALVTGFLFAALRYGLALIPALALRLPTKKIAAALALPAAAFYLMLSGAAVATERSFIMVSVMLVAVLCDRRAISLRSVAIAASLILIAQPESLIEAGFQMSFSATVALIAVFGGLGRVRGRLWPPPGWAAPVATLALSSLTAGLATAPFGAAYFGRMSSYGLIANLLTVPVMGMIEMPGAVIAGLLAPFGLEGPALWVVGMAARWILAVADVVAHLGGAARPVAAPPAVVLPVLALGMLWLALWQGRARVAGLLPAVAALVVWAGAGRPALLIADTGALVGLMTPEGRALSKPSGGGFAAHAWLQADGDAGGEEAAAARPGFAGPSQARAFDIGGLTGMVLTGKGALADLDAACAVSDLVVVGERTGPPPAGCRVIDPWVLRRTGALAGWREGGQLVFVAAREVQGDRPWTRAGHRWPLRIPLLPPIPLSGGVEAPGPRLARVP